MRRGRGQQQSASTKNMQEQFFFYAGLPITIPKPERFTPFVRPGSAFNPRGQGYYANIYDTIERRLVWEKDFNTDEEAHIAMSVELSLLARLAARPRSH